MALVIAAIASLFLHGCASDLRRIDLSDLGRERPGQSVSYLLVDKSDYSADGQILVERIGDTKLDLILDPAVYIVASGTHTISFVFHDFRKTQKLEQQLAVTMQPGRYYQVTPIRSGVAIRFELTEIDKDKPEEVGRRELKSMINYLRRGE